MQEIRVSHSQVLVNLSHFKESVHEKYTKSRKKQQGYSVWLDCKTGVMEFDHKKAVSTANKKELKIFLKKNKLGATKCTIRGDLSHEDLLVQRIVRETMEVLNLLFTIASQEPPEEKAMRVFSQVHIEEREDRPEKCPGWKGECSRIEAENLLQDRPVGAYLLRQVDQVSRWMLDQNPILAQGVVLTVKEKEAKISDYLILKTDRGWAFFHDDPQFTHYPVFPSLQALLDTFREIATLPVLTSSILE